MSKENMTMDEAYTCPRCGGQAVSVGAMEQILSDARSEEITCMKCGSSWMVYYKMLDFNKKVLNITDTPLENAAPVVIDLSDCDTVTETIDADTIEKQSDVSCEVNENSELIQD